MLDIDFPGVLFDRPGRERVPESVRVDSGNASAIPESVQETPQPSGVETHAWLQTSAPDGEAPVEIADCLSRMQAICERHEVPLAAAAIQFPLAHFAVAAVIPGAKTPAEARQNHAFLHTDIPAAVWQDFKTEGLVNADAPTP